MKKIHIIAIVLIILAVGVLFMASNDIATYSTFSEAEISSKKVKVAGQLMKEKDMIYDPIKDPNYFSFHLKDVEGTEKKVILLGAKPQDFEMSEQLVLTGKMNGGDFVATEMLMKCPSKYKDEEEYLKLEG